MCRFYFYTKKSAALFGAFDYCHSGGGKTIHKKQAATSYRFLSLVSFQKVRATIKVVMQKSLGNSLHLLFHPP